MNIDQVKQAAERRNRIKAFKEKSQDIYGVTWDETKGRAAIIEAGHKVKRAMLDDEEALVALAVAVLADPSELLPEMVWVENEVGLISQTPLGSYQVWTCIAPMRWARGGETSRDCASLEAGKAACREHLRAKVRELFGVTK